MRGKDGKTFWERVVEALADQGVSTDHQTVVAKLLGIRQPSVWEWEHEGGHPSMKNARRLALVLGVSTAWLLDGLGDKRPLPSDPQSQRLIEVWFKAPEAVRDRILSFALFALAENNPLPHSSHKKAVAQKP